MYMYIIYVCPNNPSLQYHIKHSQISEYYFESVGENCQFISCDILKITVIEKDQKIWYRFNKYPSRIMWNDGRIYSGNVVYYYNILRMRLNWISS